MNTRLYYLIYTPSEDESDFGFTTNDFIEESNIPSGYHPISKEIYDKYFEEFVKLTDEKAFRVKNPKGKTFDDIFEKFSPELERVELGFEPLTPKQIYELKETVDTIIVQTLMKK